MTNFAAYR